jgi:hypothetical protein
MLYKSVSYHCAVYILRRNSALVDSHYVLIDLALLAILALDHDIRINLF